ncbi:bifunctional lysine-specific demethylase and histidyl-hydroxylase NO66 [Manduca sexta]|uniref:bifunctional lysine-specific demethylase and histidyl-hydroxylase NO66 n=1 Tax=Manduca sexta TaxID=7130 RepID=UPI00188DEB97|nr:bifunctional lysine-specific demethylase and histidyl-hydroxylase NO66 [Manduca sexta]
MDTPVSAFAVYTANKKANKEKKDKKKHKKLALLSEKNVSKEIPREVQVEIAKKLKKKLVVSNAVKKKAHKKKRAKKQNIDLPRKKENLDIKQDSESSGAEDIPKLVKARDPVSDYSSDDSQDGVSFPFLPVYTDSVEEGLKVFKWMIAPYDPDEFLNKVWENKPLHISRKKPRYYKEIISTPIIDKMLHNENIQYTKNIDITSYVNNKRETHNPEGRAYAHSVWDSYLNGCSIRLLNPQTYIPKLHLLNATLQEFFNSFVGANAYLTPPDSQGFAPHYDDIEAFILQAEGKKHWRIYKPLDKNSVLPRVSSKNYEQEEIGEPVMEVTLQAGDMLYFPRGYIHQGVTIDGEHSLHVTISMYQQHSWADLLSKMIPAALQIAINENVEFRRGLPFDLYDNFGLVNSDVNTPRRGEITDIIHTLFNQIKEHLPIDDSVDQMHKTFLHAALPPVLNDREKAVTVFGDTAIMTEQGKVLYRVEISLDTRIRLLRKNILRMVSEEKIRLYYYVENSLEYHGSELPYFEIEEEFAPAIETLIVTYPQYVAVENLDIPNDSDKLQLVDTLWSRGLVMSEYPMETVDD